jgi:hypothetical protein
MGKVFASAQRVVVWLGPARHNSDRAIQLLREIAAMIEIDEHGAAKPNDQAKAPWTELHHRVTYKAADLRVLASFFRRSWFSRLWVLQDVGVAKESNIKLMCGARSPAWQKLQAAVIAINEKNTAFGAIRTVMSPLHAELEHAHRVILCANTPADALLVQAQRALCSDPRDKTYGLLGLIERVEGGLEAMPKYTAPVSQVYQDLVINFATQKKRLDLLSCFEAQLDAEESISWAAPTIKSNCRLQYIAADGWSPASAHVVRPGVLRASGVSVAIVKSAILFDIPWVRASNFKNQVESVLLADDLDAAHSFGGTKRDAYCYVFAGGEVSELVPTSHTFPLAMISRCLVESFLYNTKEVEALHHMEANGPDYTATRNRVNAARHTGLFTPDFLDTIWRIYWPWSAHGTTWRRSCRFTRLLSTACDEEERQWLPTPRRCVLPWLTVW